MESIVIVGGGAGGLELAAKLGRALGRAAVTLIDRRPFHVWKPSLHEVAAGTLDIHAEGLSYQMLGRDNGFSFVFGALSGLDVAHREVVIGEILDEDGSLLVPERRFSYSKLVLAIGSESNFFGIPGAAEYCVSLNGTDDAERFRVRMLKLLVGAQSRKGPNDEPVYVDIVIVGGGATGVELAAELREASSAYADYRLPGLGLPAKVRITLLEGDSRILAPLPKPVSEAAARLLAQRGVTVVASCKVARIEPGVVHDSSGASYPADLCVWAAGIKAPALLAGLGLPTNRLDQIEVDGTLAVKGVADIYALGDCAACLMENGRSVPPRAQAAHQEASYLARRLLGQVRNRTPSSAPYIYADHGSLVSIGHQSTVGSLMGVLGGAGFFVEGLFARVMYISLHLMHHQAVVGTVRTALLALSRFLRRRTAPHVKLH
jgi:NADH:ubiquinone reductase (H+-translocating)